MPDYIAGIHNYCDRWCELCSLTARCTVYAADTRVRELGSSAPAPEAPAPPGGPDGPGAWNRAGGSPLDEGLELASLRSRDRAARKHPLAVEASGYGLLVYDWLERTDVKLASRGRGTTGPAPRAVITHFALYIPSKVYRAISGAIDPDERAADVQGDANGSAKAALLGIERSLAAWQQLEVGDGHAAQQVRTFVELLERLRAELEQRFPRAHLFMRPGFDEIEP